VTDSIRQRKHKVGVFGAYYPAYRYGVFSRLVQIRHLDFTFHCGERPRGSHIRPLDARDIGFRSLRSYEVAIPGTRNAVRFRGGCISAMLRRDYDVVILTNDILGPDIWLSCLLSHWVGIPVCLWGQGISRPPSWLRDTLRYWLTSLATAALYYTDSVKNYWIKKGIPSEKLFVAYNALNTDEQIRIRDSLSLSDLDAFLSSHGLAGRKIVTFLGRLIPEKKPWLFLDIVKKTVALEPTIIGIIIGDGPERERLEAQAHHLGISGQIRFLGAVYEEELLAKYLMTSVVVVLPAFAGLAIQHAAVYGTPLILGDLPHSHGPEQEIVVHNHTGLWSPAEDIDAFANAILRLIREPDLRCMLSHNLKKIIDEKYNVERMTQGFLDAVHYCLHGRTY